MTELARLRCCAKALRRLFPHNNYRVSLKYNTIFQIGYFAGLPCDFSQSLEAWEAVVAQESQP